MILREVVEFVMRRKEVRNCFFIGSVFGFAWKFCCDVLGLLGYFSGGRGFEFSGWRIMAGVGEVNFYLSR